MRIELFICFIVRIKYYLNIEDHYCKIRYNGLQDNTNKNKIIVFCKSGKLKREMKLKYNENELEVLKYYMYLDVTFTKACEQFLTKVKLLCGSTLETTHEDKNIQLESKNENIQTK